MCAWVYKRGSRWYLAYRGETGELVRKSSRARYKPEAEKLAAQLEVEAELVRLGLKKRAQSRTWDELCDRWARDVLPNLRQNRNRAGELRRYLRPAFEGWALHGVTPGDIDTWVTGLRRKGLGDSTRWLLRMRLHTLFSFAVRLEWLASNPVAKAARVKVPQKDPTFLTVEETRKLLGLAPDYFRPILATALYCGLRRGELAGLKWEDVDLEARLLHVRRSFDGPTKGSREDVVPIPEALVPHLREAQLLRTSDWCFPARGGKARRSGWRASTVLKPLLAKAGITRRVTFHATRHTWATHAYAATKDLRLVQRLARHSSARTTEKYAHLLASTFGAQVDKLSYGEASRESDVHKPSTPPARNVRRARKRSVKQGR